MKRRSVVLLAVLLSVSVVAAQEIKKQDKAYTLSVDVALVALPVAVLDDNGRPAEGLKQEHFQVFEDDALQQISVFKHEDVPVSIGLVIDNSGSMRNKRERVNSAALTFVRESNREDETFIVNFDDSAYLEQDFTSSIGDLVDSLDDIDTRGETALFDAIYLSLDHLKGGRMDKKALLVVTDGEDNASKYGLNKIVERLRESNVTLYGIGLLEENDERGGVFRKSPSKKAKEALAKFAEVTGGQAFFPKSIDDVGALCSQIARDLRNHYTIGYSPSNKKLDGTWRTVRVKLNPPRNFRKVIARTKPGYYAPTGQPVSSNK